MSAIDDVLEGRERWAVVCGDCRTVLVDLPDKSVDHMITDPPYSEHVHKKQWQGHALTADGMPRCSTEHDGLGFDALTNDLRAQVSERAIMLARRWSLVFCDIEGLGAWRESLTGVGLEWVRALVWDKVDGAPQFTGDRPANGAECIAVAHPFGSKRWNGGGRRNVYRYAVNAEKGGKPHPSTKPLALMLELIRNFTDPDDVILDPFCGSGSTLVAALRLGRRAVGIDTNPSWCSVAEDRIRSELELSSFRDRKRGQVALFGGKG